MAIIVHLVDVVCLRVFYMCCIDVIWFGFGCDTHTQILIYIVDIVVLSTNNGYDSKRMRTVRKCVLPIFLYPNIVAKHHIRASLKLKFRLTLIVILSVACTKIQ